MLARNQHVVEVCQLGRSTDGGGVASVQMHAISTTHTTISFFQKEQHMLNDEPGGLHAPLKGGMMFTLNVIFRKKRHSLMRPSQFQVFSFRVVETKELFNCVCALF
jgi:hypothetical protein